MCLVLPPSGCFSRWWFDFAHWTNQYVPPTDPEGNHHSPLPGTYSNRLPSVRSKQRTDQSDFFLVLPVAPGHIAWSRAGTWIKWHPLSFSHLNPQPCAFDFGTVLNQCSHYSGSRKESISDNTPSLKKSCSFISCCFCPQSPWLFIYLLPNTLEKQDFKSSTVIRDLPSKPCPQTFDSLEDTSVRSLCLRKGYLVTWCPH